jgi:hypothetical protein
MKTRGSAILAVTLMALGFGGCGSSSATTTAAVITQSVTPNPVVAQPSTDPAFQFTASFTVTLRESGGVGITFATLSPAVYEASGGMITTLLPAGNSRTTITVPSNRVEANSTLLVDYKVDYTAPNTGRVIVVRITVTGTDDHGFTLSGFVDVPVS